MKENKTTVYLPIQYKVNVTEEYIPIKENRNRPCYVYDSNHNLKRVVSEEEVFRIEQEFKIKRKDFHNYNRLFTS